MKIIVLIARYLLVLTFFVLGLNGFLFFIKGPPPDSDLARQFLTVLMKSHYSYLIFAVQIIGGMLFLFRATVPLALVFIGPVLVNILTYHITMDPRGIVPGIVATVLWVIVFWTFRRAFAGIIPVAR